MKQLMMKSAIFSMAMTVAAAFTACSDNDSESSLIVNNNEKTVSINRLGGSIEIPITASGSWTAEVTEDSDENLWACAMVDEGNGDAKLQVNVDYFNPKLQKQERTANLVVKCGDKTQTIRIRQYIGLKDGETAPNADVTPYFDLWFSKGLGCGLDPLTGDMTSPVLNIYGIQKAINDGGAAYKGLLRQTVHTNAANEVIRLDTLEDNMVGLTAQASIEVSYLKFKLKIGVKYENTDSQLVNIKNYQAVQKLVFLDANVDNMTISALLDDDQKIARGETKNMFTAGFQSYYKKITQATDSVKRQGYIKKLIQGYGPVYVTGAELGGDLFVSMRYDSIMAKNNFSVGGELSLDLALGPVNIDANVHVDYTRDGRDLWSSSHHYAKCSGGDQKAITELAALVNQVQPNPDLVKQLGQTWARSIISSNDVDDNTSLVRITYVPIWNLFPDDIADEIQAYAQKYYQGKDLGINPAVLGFVTNAGNGEK